MINARLTNCTECSDILSLIEDIDCRFTELGENMYNNLVYMLNKPVPASTMFDMLTYKRILQSKYVNPSYAGNYTVGMIAGKIKLLKFRQ